MSDKESKSRFFDHSLQNRMPSQEIFDKTDIETNHDQFIAFRSTLQSLFKNIQEGDIYILYAKHGKSENPLLAASNEFMDRANEKNVQNITQSLSNQKAEPAKIKPQYKYQSRKRDAGSMSNGDIIENFKGTNNRPLNTKPRTATRGKKSNSSSFPKPLIQSNNEEDGKRYWKKYIGTFNVSCWCTRSIYGLKSIYEENRLIFSKPQNSDVVYVNHQRESSEFHREMGRASEEFAELIAPLLDEKAVIFESKLFFVEDERLGTGDSFIIRTDCFLSEYIFENNNSDALNDELDMNQLKVMKDSNGNVDAGTKLKTSLLKLFAKIELKSVKETKNKKKEIISLSDNDDDNDDLQFEELQRIREERRATDLDDEETDEASNTDKLSMNQVKELYKNTEMNNLQNNIPESIPNDFNIELRPYQKQGLSWMLQREKEYNLVGLNNNNVEDTEKELVIQQLKDSENTFNPLWKEYTWPTVPERLQHLELPENCNDSFYLNLYKGTCSLFKPFLKSSCKGGILADEMGLGKTITTLSLIMSYPEDTHYEALPEDHIEKIDNYAFKTTLIVLPMALLTQWEREFMKVSKDSGKNRCFIYYGSETLGNLKMLLCGPNPPTVVLTTYGTIQSEWSRMDKSEMQMNEKGLYSIKFLRIILDEGHNIRNRDTKTARAIYDLKADRNWILTGTPIINRLEDLFSLIHFLKLHPWSYHALWKQCISLPFDTGKNIDVALELLKSILDPILLRRTKNQKDGNGNYLVVLPPKEVIIEELTFNQREENIYNWLKEKAVNSFNENFQSGLVFKNYSTILTQLLRLRQVCCHVDLIKTSHDESMDDMCLSKEDQRPDRNQQKLTNRVDVEMSNLIEVIENNERQQRISNDKINQLKSEIYKQYPTFDDIECSICTELISVDSCIITECKHCFCISCLNQYFEFQIKHEKVSHMTNEAIATNVNTATSLTSNSRKKNAHNYLIELMLMTEEVFCPMCRKKINRNRLLRAASIGKNVTNNVNLDTNEVFLTQEAPGNNERKYYIRPFVPNEQSSKINALLIHLEQIRNESPGEHVIVFSQFTSFLDIISSELDKYVGEFKVYKFDGRLNLEQRQKTLAGFEQPIPIGEHKISVLLLSLKAGGVGLNLTVASRAFLMDPHWNNAIEFQAIDRIHRVGQMKNVKVIRFIMSGSIEERMLLIQKKKNQLGEALTISDEERKKRKLEELQSLFKE